ncbi:hypothetical protein [Parvibaculum sp.]|uniref:hypothetical protein n=1 Tax=Parvibaculum sp. TaxID=2024848 RepID=UPI002CDE7E28|nr:hypothetical protein [Parvibaculum sp.]HUD50119.1 hypothetical protein [Parvibaculum sp.]
MNIAALRANKPLRNLAILAFATAIAVVAATVAVVTMERGVSVKFTPEPLFPGLETKLDQVGRITYSLGRGLHGVDKITLNRGADGQWTVAERQNYPAKQDLVQKALIGISELMLYEPRTARPEWHRNLGLLAPEDLGSATRIQLFDKAGKPMASFLAGKVPDETSAARGQGMIYLRRDGDNQTWLARGRFPLFQAAQDWLDARFLDLKRDEIKRVTLWAGTDHPVVMDRTSADQNDFTLENIPKGRVTRGAPVVNGTATSVVDLNFDDAVPVGSLEFPATSPNVIVETFDGLRVTLTLTGGGGALWAKVMADTDPVSAAGGDTKAAGEKAKMLNDRLTKWAYKLPQQAGNQLTQSVDLLTHEAGPEK